MSVICQNNAETSSRALTELPETWSLTFTLQSREWYTVGESDQSQRKILKILTVQEVPREMAHQVQLTVKLNQ